MNVIGGNEIINVECIETDSYSNEADSCTNQNENESITSDGSLLQHGKSFIQRNKEVCVTVVTYVLPWQQMFS